MASEHQYDIKHSNAAEYYELYIDGKLYGTYDTAEEAAKDIELMKGEADPLFEEAM